MPDVPAPTSLVFLHPGKLVTADRPLVVKTVLGSCLAITMWAPRLRAGSICHCLLPNAGVPFGSLSQSERLRYVDATIEIMLADFAARGVAREELEIKLYGGADRIGPKGYAVGGRNVKTAREVLSRHGMRVAESITGGSCGRVIQFDTAAGSVSVRLLPALLEDPWRR